MKMFTKRNLAVVLVLTLFAVVFTGCNPSDAELLGYVGKYVNTKDNSSYIEIIDVWKSGDAVKGEVHVANYSSMSWVSNKGYNDFTLNSDGTGKIINKGNANQWYAVTFNNTTKTITHSTTNFKKA